jgi:hypothetical protein
MNSGRGRKPKSMFDGALSIISWTTSPIRRKSLGRNSKEMMSSIKSQARESK